MQGEQGLSAKVGAALDRRSGWFILAILAITALLVIPLLTMAPEEEASDNPGGQVFDLQEDIDQRFPPSVHSAGIIVEASPGEDVLTQQVLLELYGNTNRLRRADQEGELAPPGLEAQPYLFSFYFAEIERPVVGIYTLADAVQDVLTRDPRLNTTLEQASDDQVKLAVHHLLSGPTGAEFRDNLSVKTTKERRQVLGQEIDYWRSSALLTFMVADNEKLGGGSLRIGASGDETTTDKERFNRKVQELLRGDQESYRLWGIAIDVGLEVDDEVGLAGPFIMFTAIGVLIVVGVALRSYWAVALTGAGLGILMIWLKGTSNLIGLKSGLVIDLIVPIAMISLGVDFAIHALRRYREEKDRGYAPRMALRVGFAGVLGALALAMMTDGVAFLSNATSGIEAVIGFGIAAAVAVMASFIILGLVAPVAMMRIDALRTSVAEGKDVAQSAAPQRGWIAALGHVLAMVVAACVTGAAVILLVALSPLIGIAVIAAFIVLGILLPVLVIARLERRRRGPGAGGVVAAPAAGGADTLPDTTQAKESMARGALVSIVVKVAERRAILLPAVVVLTAVAIFFALRLEATLDVEDFFDSKSDFVVSLDKLDEHVGERAGEPGLVYIKGDLSAPESLRAIQQLLDRMERNPYMARTAEGELNLGTTVFNFLKRITGNEYVRAQVERVTGVEIGDADGDGIPDTDAQVEAAYDYMVQYGIPLNESTLAYEPARVRQTLFHDLSGAEKDVTIMEFGVPGSRELSVVRAARKALEEDLEALNGTSSISFFGLTGSPFTREASLNATTRALYIALPIAVVLCFLVSLLVMRSVRFAIVTIVPVGLVVAWLLAFMYLAGFALNFVSAIIAAVSIGIGIDYAIHLTQRFREELRKSGERLESLRQAAQGTGVALLASAASSIVGFVIMGFAPMPVFSAYGILTAIMILAAVAAALLVLPSLLLLVTPGSSQHETGASQRG